MIDDRTHTRSSLPAVSPRSPSSAPTGDRAETILALLGRLALHYYRPDFTEAHAKLVMADMIGDLIGYTPEQIAVACERWRKSEARHFPRSGDIIAKVGEHLREARLLGPRHQSEHDLRWQEWLVVRASAFAEEAAREGYSWSLRCAVLNDGKRRDQIDVRGLAQAHRYADRQSQALEKGTAVWDRSRNREVAFSEDNRARALSLWRGLLVQEAETAQEIAAARRHTI